ncbi:hypothetical protein [Maritalea sp.]|uniref:hypothetical protein n=1 Tax=Maritalea sp. TaxID=2003361 RepID=UPI003EFB0A73
MFSAIKKSLTKSLAANGIGPGKPFALTTRDKNGKKLKNPAPLTRQETLARLAEINQKIGKMSLVARKATNELNLVELGSPEAMVLAKKCAMALEHCAKTSIQNDYFYGSIESCNDPNFMDRKHATYGARLDEIATVFSSILKRICKD